MIKPITEKHIKEIEELELKNTRLTALFAQLNPDPLIRVSAEGIITYLNKTAEEMYISTPILNSYIVDFIPEFSSLDFHDIIENDLSLSSIQRIFEKYYSVVIKGVSALDFAQLYFHDITERKEFEQQLENYQSKLKELTRYLDRSAEEERRKIAEELHDSIGQELSLLKLQLQRLNENKINYEKDLHKIISSVDQITINIRNISHRLKPISINGLGLIPALNALANSIIKIGHLEGNFSAYGEDNSIEPNIVNVVYRTCQEALNNIIKHSKATKFGIQLMIDPDKIRLVISDNGVGFESDKIASGLKFPKGLGIFNIKENIESLNGKLKIESRVNEGTALIINIPLRTNND